VQGKSETPCFGQRKILKRLEQELDAFLIKEYDQSQAN